MVSGQSDPHGILYYWQVGKLRWTLSTEEMGRIGSGWLISWLAGVICVSTTGDIGNPTIRRNTLFVCQLRGTHI